MKERFENQYLSEQPFIEQSFSFKEGMQYRFSPDSYPISPQQYKRMTNAGAEIGGYLEALFADKILEFRLDFAKSEDGELFIIEVQTDDRGLPAIAIARNARGIEQPNLLPGTSEMLTASFKQKAKSEKPVIGIAYPSDELFYYAGFYDVARFCAAIDPNVSLITLSDNEIGSVKGPFVKTKQVENGATFIMQPDFVWNFSEINFGEIEEIQPLVTKQILLDLWTSESIYSTRLKTYVPEISLPMNPNVIKDKNRWILKPVNGRWSKGIAIGKDFNQEDWETIISQSDGLLIAQNFVRQPQEEFRVRKKSGEFEIRNFYSRVEGYYIKLDEQWILADILATCTPELPIHGQRDCIMIPGKVI